MQEADEQSEGKKKSCVERRRIVGALKERERGGESACLVHSLMSVYSVSL